MKISPKLLLKRATSLTLAAFVAATALSPSALATSFTQGYQSSEQLSLGTLVSLAKEGDNKIEAATTDNDDRMLGVVADASGAIIDLQPKGSNIRVAISGDAKVLVASSAGDIKKGDYLVTSPLAGIAEKDNGNSASNKYTGVAQEDFNTNSAGAQKTTVQLTNGSQREIVIGTITANILLSDRNPGDKQESSNILSVIGEKLTGKQVSPLRVVASAVVVLSVVTITGWMLNGSIRGSFVSLGRNPLAKSSILTNLMRVVVIALFIFGIGLVSAYLILSL